MMNAVLLEDEPAVQELMSDYVQRYCPELCLIGSAASVDEGIRVVVKLRPDVLFLDVELRDGDCFELLNRLETVPAALIFITAHSHYAIEAIRHYALDYLLKPIMVSDLKRAVARLNQRCSAPPAAQSPQAAAETIQPHKPASAPLALPTIDGYVLVDVGDVVRLEAHNSYTAVSLADGRTFTVCKTLQDYADLLAADNFIRIHKAHLVNMRHVRKYVKGRGGHLVMSDGAVLSVSIRKRETFLYGLKKV